MLHRYQSPSTADLELGSASLRQLRKDNQRLGSSERWLWGQTLQPGYMDGSPDGAHMQGCHSAQLWLLFLVSTRQNQSSDPWQSRWEVKPASTGFSPQGCCHWTLAGIRGGCGMSQGTQVTYTSQATEIPENDITSPLLRRLHKIIWSGNWDYFLPGKTPFPYPKKMCCLGHLKSPVPIVPL